ncbi:MAG TPA: tetratricopeptide repeat protein [Allosphingosinicella sp.]
MVRILLFALLVQIFCAVHCIRNGRNSLWLMVIIFLNLPGCFAYIVFEILPGLAGRREVRAAKQAAIRTLDPERDVRLAREAVETTDTAANRIMLGDALAGKGEWGEAVPHYREALAKMPAGDRPTLIKLARALLESGDCRGARDLLETLPESGSRTETDRGALLLARALQECGEKDRALALYAELGDRMTGAEAQCRHAALLIEQGKSGEAVALLEEAGRRAKKLDRHERAREADMYAWAERTLGELRGR